MNKSLPLTLLILIRFYSDSIIDVFLKSTVNSQSNFGRPTKLTWLSNFTPVRLWHLGRFSYCHKRYFLCVEPGELQSFDKKKYTHIYIHISRRWSRFQRIFHSACFNFFCFIFSPVYADPVNRRYFISVLVIFSEALGIRIKCDRSQSWVALPLVFSGFVRVVYAWICTAR